MAETLTEEEFGQRIEELVGRLFMGAVSAFELVTIHLGVELGLYDILAEKGALTPRGLADAAAIDERYAREWLEQQAAAGFVEVDDPTKATDERAYALPAPYTEVLVNKLSQAYVAPLGALVSSVGRVMPELIAAYRSGDGIPFSHYGQYVRDAQGAFNRPSFATLLGSSWIPEGVPELDARFRTDPPASVLDIGCGYGWSSIALSEAYPKIKVVGIDSDEPSVDQARQHAKEAAVAERVTFQVADAASPEFAERFDAAFIFEALHDMSHPVDVLRAARSALTKDGIVVVMDERVGDEFTAPANEIERFFYACSVLHCLPAGRSEPGSAATGTVMRTSTVRRYANDAGFTSVEIIPIDHDFFRFYKLSS
jgi:2-polyprenyl-3-methyl-5-hydroxy-6-metoxy-1,4-benzoquinol methylase